MIKQDRQGVRRVSDLERRYDLGAVKEVKEQTIRQKAKVERVEQESAANKTALGKVAQETAENKKELGAVAQETEENKTALGKFEQDLARTKQNLSEVRQNLDDHTHKYAGSQSEGGAADNALKLENFGISKKGARYNAVPFVESSGGMKVGKTLEFYAANTSEAAAHTLQADSKLKYDGKPLPEQVIESLADKTGVLIVGDICIEFGVVAITTGEEAAQSLYTGSASITFAHKYAYAPCVLAGWSGRYNNMHSCGSLEATVSGVTIWGKTSTASSQRNVQWIAIGKLA